MTYNIENCSNGDADYICDRLVEFNLSKYLPNRMCFLKHSTKRSPMITVISLLAASQRCTVEMYCILIFCG